VDLIWTNTTGTAYISGDLANGFSLVGMADAATWYLQTAPFGDIGENWENQDGIEPVPTVAWTNTTMSGWNMGGLTDTKTFYSTNLTGAKVTNVVTIRGGLIMSWDQ
jgi:hypothetical protein